MQGNITRAISLLIFINISEIQQLFQLNKRNKILSVYINMIIDPWDRKK